MEIEKILAMTFKSARVVAASPRKYVTGTYGTGTYGSPAVIRAYCTQWVQDDFHRNCFRNMCIVDKRFLRVCAFFYQYGTGGTYGTFS